MLFGVNSLCLVAAGQASGRLVRRVAPERLLSVALALMTVGGLLLLGCALLRTGHVQGVMVPMWAVLAGVGVVTPNATALALADYPHSAGTASAFFGSAQFIVGGSAGAPDRGLPRRARPEHVLRDRPGVRRQPPSPSGGRDPG